MTAMRFPTRSARDLEGSRRRVPDDLEGEPRILLVAFDRFQQSSVNAWVAALEAERHRAPGMRLYEIPTIGSQWRWARPFIDGTMVAAIPDLDVRRRTLTIYAPVAPILRALGLADRSEVCAVVLAPDGSVRAKAVGAPTAESVRTIVEAL